MSPARRRLTAWIASFAILLAALAPTLAQALATVGERAAPWTEICTTTGTQPGSENPAGNDGQHPHGIKHCPWCSGSHHTYALASADYAPPLQTRTGISPADFRQLPQGRIRDRGTSLPRAPPAFS